MTPTMPRLWKPSGRVCPFPRDDDLEQFPGADAVAHWVADHTHWLLPRSRLLEIIATLDQARLLGQPSPPDRSPAAQRRSSRCDPTHHLIRDPRKRPSAQEAKTTRRASISSATTNTIKPEEPIAAAPAHGINQTSVIASAPCMTTFEATAAGPQPRTLAECTDGSGGHILGPNRMLHRRTEEP